MHSMILHIEDDFYSEFKQIVDRFVAQKKIAYTPVEIKHRNTIVVSSILEIQERIHRAKEGIAKGHYIEEEQFWNKVDKHLEDKSFCKTHF